MAENEKISAAENAAEKPQENPYGEQEEYANSLGADASSAKESVVSTIKDSMRDAEASFGYHSVRDMTALYGAGSIGRSFAKSDAESWILRTQAHNEDRHEDGGRNWQKNSERYAYSTDSVDSMTDERFVHNGGDKIRDGVGSRSTVGMNTSGSVLNDYRDSKSSLRSALEQDNVSKMSTRQMRRETQTRWIDVAKHQKDRFQGKATEKELSGAARNDYNAMISKMANDKADKKVKYFDAHAGGIKNTAREWIRQSYSDADAAKGYKQAKLAGKVAGGSVVAVKYSAYGAVQGSLSTVKHLDKATFNVREARAFAKGKRAGLTNAQLKAQSDKMKADLGTRIQGINNQKDRARGIFKRANTTDIKRSIKRRVGNGIYKRLPPGMQARLDQAQHLKRRFMDLKMKVNQSKFMMAARKPFQFLSGIKKGLIKVAFAFAGVLLLDALILCIFMPMVSVVIAPLSVFNHEAGTVNAQEIIDEMAAKQNGYREIVQNGTSSKGYTLPSGWDITSDKITINGVAASIDVSKYKNGQGYNFSGLSSSPSMDIFTKDSSDKSLTLFKAERNSQDLSNPTVKSIPVKILAGAALSGGEDIYVESLSYDKDGNAYIDLSGQKTGAVDIQANYEYCGSKSDQTLTEDKSGSYTLTDGSTQNYNCQAFYKGIISCVTALSDNEDKDVTFFKKYCNQLFDAVMSRASVRVNVKYTPNPDKKIRIHIKDTGAEAIKKENDDGQIPMSSKTLDALENCKDQYIEVTGYDVESKVVISLNVGLPDQMDIDGADNEWLKANAANTEKFKDKLRDYTPEQVRDMDPDTLQAIKNEQVTWKGWNTEVDAREWAVAMYEMDWDDYGITFPNDNMAPVLSSGAIDDILSQIEKNNNGLDAGAKEFLRFALQQVGNFYYLYGGKVNPNNLGKPPAGLDCSGYVSYALYAGGLNDFVPRSAGDFGRRGSPFNGNFDSLKPGTIIARNTAYGTATNSENHVVIYLGKFQYGDDKEPRHYCVECTEWGQLSGVMLSSPEAMRLIATYGYAWYPQPLHSNVGEIPAESGVPTVSN